MENRILIINGPNINLTGFRDPELYGTSTLEEINNSLNGCADELSLTVDFFQSNSEGEIVDCIHSAIGIYAGIIINAGAYSHYSYAIRDSIEACKIPTVEVHMSNIYAREEFRQKSVLSAVCSGTITGFGSFGYHLALAAIAEKIKE